MRELMGLDKPAVERYADWLGGLLRGDLGNSAAGYAAGGEVPIWGEIDTKVVNSFILAALTTLFMIPLSLLLGTIAATRAGRSRRPRHLADGARRCRRCPSSWSARC